MTDRPMRFAYADPPYPGGKARRYYRDHADYAGEVDHAALIDRLEGEFPDGWALSTSAELYTFRAKPAPFLWWLFNCLGARPGDELVDLFPGSGAVARAWEAFAAQPTLPRTSAQLAADPRTEVLA